MDPDSVEMSSEQSIHNQVLGSVLNILIFPIQDIIPYFMYYVIHGYLGNPLYWYFVIFLKIS